MENVQKMKGLVQAQLPAKELQSLVKDLAKKTRDSNEIKEALLKSGVIDKLSQQLNKTLGDTKKSTNSNGNITAINDTEAQVSLTNQSLTSAKPLLTKLKPGIHLSIQNGHAFLSSTEMTQDPTNTLTIHLLFKGNRVSSKPVLSSIDPIFDLDWLIPFQENISLSSFADSNFSVHIVVCRANAHQDKNIIGTALMLLQPKSSKLVEIKDVFDNQLVVGLLDLVVEQNTFQYSEQAVEQINFKVKKALSLRNERYKSFLHYTRQWWSDFLQIRPTHASRLVKLFAVNESGMKEPVTNFISPVQVNWLQTPRHAARYVSLLGYEKSIDGASTKSEVWLETHTILSAGKGDTIELSILLCSLLLGTNKRNETYAWVTVSDSKGEVTFWDSLTGEVSRPSDKPIFRTIGCCFNDRSFYANIQPSDGMTDCCFKLNDHSIWKKLSEDSIMSMRKPVDPFRIQKYQFKSDIDSLESDLLSDLKHQISCTREDHGLACHWDNDLSYILGQSIWKSEISKITEDSPLPSMDSYFKQGIIRCIPEGHTFKGFPVVFNYTHSQRIFSKLLETKSFREILFVRGDKVRFGIQIRCFPYAENGIATWIMLGARFQSLAKVST